MNFFNWLRDGVRSAVLHGVNDAVETIGDPSENSKFREELTLAIERDSQAALPGKRTRKASGSKRLGRSLKDVEPAGKAAEASK